MTIYCKSVLMKLTSQINWLVFDVKNQNVLAHGEKIKIK